MVGCVKSYSVYCKAAEYKAGGEAEDPATSSRNIRRATNAILLILLGDFI